jgi:ABC-type lipoprotein release transport system permease subunit
MENNSSAKLYKGNILWPLAYAYSSMKNYSVRNAGIALVLAIGISIPTTVFVWSHTGIEQAVFDYFSERAYLMSLRPQSGQTFNSTKLDKATEWADNHKYIYSADLVASSVGVLLEDNMIGYSSYYNIMNTNYYYGIKDARVIFVTNKILDTWSTELDYQGTTSLSLGEIIVSEGFINYTREVHNYTLGIGDKIDIDLLQNLFRGQASGTPEQLGKYPIANLTIAGIYQTRGQISILGGSFLSISRRNWDPMAPSGSAVLGLNDAILILQNQVPKEVYRTVLLNGIFDSISLLRPSVRGLLNDGPENIESGLLSFRTQFEEQFPGIRILGLQDTWKLGSYVKTYLQSQILTVIAFPVMIMSLILTFFMSETSISRRKGELNSLRSKGASYNQIFSAFMWESFFLSIIAFIIGIVMSLIMAPYIASSRGLFLFDMEVYTDFISGLVIPPVALAIAGAIAFYLPATSLIHVARRIEVAEVGQPGEEEIDEIAAEPSVWRHAFGLASVLSVLLLLPFVMGMIGTSALNAVLIATALLFIASYLGSRLMQIVTSRFSSKTSTLIGEKSLYLSQSMRRRKRQFIPLLVILTLTLTSTLMLMIQNSSFESTLENELRYAIGADLRVECSDKPLNYSDIILDYPGVEKVTSVIETSAQVGSNTFYLEGIDPIEYLQVGLFSQESFVSGTPDTVLNALVANDDGIIISEFYANLWNHSIGEWIEVTYRTSNSTRLEQFTIVGIMRSAPGFGLASTIESTYQSFPVQFGFQVSGNGFALANIDRLTLRSGINTSDLFFADLTDEADVASIVAELDSERYVDAYSSETYDFTTESTSIQIFMNGIQGLTVVGFVMCLIMGLEAIALFLWSAVLERKYEYAIIRAVGGTKRQVVSMVFSEFAGSVIAAIGISIILGIIFGYTMAVLTFGISPFIPILSEVLSYPLNVLIGVLTLEAVVMVASCYFPARKAGMTDPADVLRNL